MQIAQLGAPYAKGYEIVLVAQIESGYGSTACQRHGR